jgi:hypothetical protein
LKKNRERRKGRGKKYNKKGWSRKIIKEEQEKKSSTAVLLFTE